MPATPCPGNPGCRCPSCWGLKEFMSHLTGVDYGLPVTCRPLTSVPVLVDGRACDGSMTCPCSACVVVKTTPRPPVKQPWQPIRKAA